MLLEWVVAEVGRRWGARRPRCASARASSSGRSRPAQRAQLQCRSRRHSPRCAFDIRCEGHGDRARHPGVGRVTARGRPKQWQNAAGSGRPRRPVAAAHVGFRDRTARSRASSLSSSALYFMIRRGPERAASRDLPGARIRPPRRLCRGLPAFPVVLDRDAGPGVPHGGSVQRFKVRIIGLEQLDEASPGGAARCCCPRISAASTPCVC